MSDLTFTEKEKFEKLLGMATGYVATFSNRTFQAFILEKTGRNIYHPRYDNASGSKANRLRKFWEIEENILVGRVMGEMLDYLGESRPEVEACREIVARLCSGNPAARTKPQDANAAPALLTSLAELQHEFYDLAVEKDRQKAGLALEKLLHRLFVLFQLHPRQPFRVIGEQIDGSFELDGHVYLLEAKWEQKPLPEADLLVFAGKIEKKSTFTRGVFVSLNGVSNEARQAITQGKAPSFFVMDGHDLMTILGGVITLSEFLRRRVRLLAEEGRVCVPFSELG